jgi:iron complex transport system ATP-binding protein
MRGTLIDIRDASVVRSGKIILDNISLQIATGEHVAIVGPNGSGKSTLIKLITREIYPLAGKGLQPVIALFGNERWDVFELRTRLGILSNDLHQNFVADEALLAIDVVLSGYFASKGVPTHKTITSEMVQTAHRALELAGASHLTNRTMFTLSTGEARRVLIARALVPDPLALILDEPTAGLDLAARRRFLNAVRNITRHNKTVLLVTHHVEEIIPEIERVILVKDGKVFRDGSKSSVLTSSNLSALFDENICLRKSGEYYAAELDLLVGDRVSDLN